jgi:NDP-sugar pyrophosphorylase family protein
MMFFLLAGGYGKRAQPLSLIKPKPVFPLNGVPLIRLMLQQLEKEGVPRGFINLHYLPESIRKNVDPDMSVTFFAEEKLSGSMVLRRALSFFEDELLVCNGDVFLDLPVRQLKEKSAHSGTDGVLLVRNNPGNYPVVRVRGDDFLDIAPASREPAGRALMYAGVAVLKKNVVAGIGDLNFFTSLAKHRWRIKVVVYEGIWLELGDPLAYYRANFAYKQHVSDRGENSISPGVTIADDSIVERSVVWEGTAVSDHSVVSDSIVTGDLVIRNERFSRAIVSRLGIFALPGM